MPRAWAQHSPITRSSRLRPCSSSSLPSRASYAATRLPAETCTRSSPGSWATRGTSRSGDAHQRQDGGRDIRDVAGVALLLVGATTVFAELQSDLDRIWSARGQVARTAVGILRSRVLSFGLVASIGSFLVSLVLSAALAAFGTWWGRFSASGGVVARGPRLRVSLVAITWMFALIYKILPRAHRLARRVDRRGGDRAAVRRSARFSSVFTSARAASRPDSAPPARSSCCWSGSITPRRSSCSAPSSPGCTRTLRVAKGQTAPARGRRASANGGRQARRRPRRGIRLTRVDPAFSAYYERRPAKTRRRQRINSRRTIMRRAITAVLGLSAAAWVMLAQADVTVLAVRLGANDVAKLAKFYDAAFSLKEIDHVGEPPTEIIMRYGATVAAAKAGTSPEFLVQLREPGTGKGHDGPRDFPRVGCRRHRGSCESRRRFDAGRGGFGPDRGYAGEDCDVGRSRRQCARAHGAAQGKRPPPAPVTTATAGTR